MNEIDLVRNYWDARPCNIKHSNLEIGTREYFDAVEFRKYFVESHIPTFAEFNKWHGKTVLEIGCGIGTDAVNFAKKAIYTGVELSDKSLEITKNRFLIYNLKGTFYCGNAEELNTFLPQQKFDLIYSFGVIHHSPNPSKIIENLKNFCHEETELRIMLYAKNSWKSFMIEHGFDQPEAQYGCPIALTYTHDEIRDLLNPYFEIFEINQDHIFPYKIKEYKQYEYILEDWWKSMPIEMFKILEKKLGWHTLIKAKVIK